MYNNIPKEKLSIISMMKEDLKQRIRTVWVNVSPKISFKVRQNFVGKFYGTSYFNSAKSGQKYRIKME